MKYIGKTNKGDEGSGNRKYKGEETLGLIYEAVFEGRTNKEIAALLLINPDTFYDWKKNIPDVSETIKRAESDHRETIRNKARISLQKRIEGYTIEETQTEERKDKDGNTITKTTKTTTKHIMPDTMLLMYVLNNLDGENFSYKQKVDIDLSVEDTTVQVASPEEIELIRQLGELQDGSQRMN